MSNFNVQITDPENKVLNVQLGQTGAQGRQGDKGDQGEAMPVWMRVVEGRLQWHQGTEAPDATWSQSNFDGVLVKGADGNDGVDLTDENAPEGGVKRMNVTVATREPTVADGQNGDVWFYVDARGM